MAFGMLAKTGSVELELLQEIECVGLLETKPTECMLIMHA